MKPLLPLAGAVVVHLLLITLVVSWKPPPMGQAAKATTVSLVPGMGRAAMAAFPSTASLQASVDPKSTPAAAKPSVATKVAANQGSSLLLKPKPEPLNKLAPLLTDIASGGPSLTAEPLPLASHPAPAASASTQTVGGKSCQILETLKLGLQGSEAVKAALSMIPAKSLSVAKAILLWDGQWIDASSVGGSSTLAPIQQVVVQVVNQAPPICQTETQNGVRFITLGDSRDTTVLAFGSNDWRWADVLATVSPIILQNF